MLHFRVQSSAANRSCHRTQTTTPFTSCIPPQRRGQQISSHPLTGPARLPPRLRCAASQQNPESFFDTVKKLAKRVQGALPIVGLISRLASSEGGFDELAYPEFCRSVTDRTESGEFRKAVEALGRSYGKFADVRWLLLLLWMSKSGSGLVPARHVVDAARRLRVTQDMEIEIDRFDGLREAAAEKYSMIARPEGRLDDIVRTAVDAICTLSIGLKDGQAVSERDFPVLSMIVCQAYPQATVELVEESIRGRATRIGVYATPAKQ